jgi:hypothetical protein
MPNVGNIPTISSRANFPSGVSRALTRSSVGGLDVSEDMPPVSDLVRERVHPASGELPAKSGGLNGWMQHWLEVY